MKFPINIKGALAICIIAGFFAVLILLGLSLVEFDMSNQSALVLVGALSSSFGQVVSWYFGSSEGSSRKTDLLMRKEEVK